MALATCGGPHATIYLQTTRRLTSPRNYLPSPLYALAFILVRSCFHVLNAIPILSLLYRVPATMYYPFNNNFFLHTSYLFTSTLADHKLKIRRHIFLTLVLLRLKLRFHGLLPRGATFVVLHIAHLIFYLFVARGPCPLLPIFEASPPRTHAVGVLGAGAWGFHTISFPSPPNLRKGCYIFKKQDGADGGGCCRKDF